MNYPGSLFIVVLSLLPVTTLVAEELDLLIRQVRLLDGSGNPWRLADIGIKDDKIVRVGRFEDVRATQVIEAQDLYASPGFIDTHSHTTDALTSTDRSAAPGLLTQGVTTVLLNPDGGGPDDLAEQGRAVLLDGTGVNVGLMVPHGSVRKAVMGMEDRPATRADLKAMAALVEEGMRHGAYGLSSGTFYAPGSFSNNEELVYLAKIVARYGGVYASHIRDESDYSIGLIASVDEVIEVARQAELPGVVTHIKALGPPVWGLSEAVVARIGAARRQGVQVYTDQYPYAASSTSLGAALLPRWAQAGGRDALLRRFSEPGTLKRIRRDMEENLARRGGADRIQVSRTESRPETIGLTLAVIANQEERDAISTAIGFLRDEDPGIISFNMHDDDIATFMRAPWNMTASDGGYPVWGKGAPHPRAFGSFPRKIHHYVNEKRVITLPEAIRSMTSLPAQVYGIVDRGSVSPGNFADIVIFDLDRLVDKATFDNPYQLSQGVVHVLINGEVALRDGRLADKQYGRLLKKQLQ